MKKDITIDLREGKMERIIIFDTTLRDGEQSPGVGFTVKEKLEIAKQLEKLGVDVMEAGFPASSSGDFEAVNQISREVKGPIITALARAVPLDVKKAGEALKEAYKLKKTPAEVLKLAREAVKMARGYSQEVEFSPEDASRSDPAFLYEIINAVLEEGAGVINIPDTVGYSVPEEFGSLVGKIMKNVPAMEKVLLSVHCHNDLGQFPFSHKKWGQTNRMYRKWNRRKGWQRLPGGGGDGLENPPGLLWIFYQHQYFRDLPNQPTGLASYRNACTA